MAVNLKRPYRKNLAMRGMIYLEGKEQDVRVRNISITGVLVEVNSKEDNSIIFNTLLNAKMIDIYLPALRLAGEVEVVRVDMEHNHIVLGLIFKNIAYDVDRPPCKRKAYRKNIAVMGRILLNDSYIDFTTINVSIEGLMIHLNDTLIIKKGIITTVLFTHLHLTAEAKVIWTDTISESGTLIGLHYISLKRIKPEKITDDNIKPS